MPLSLSADRERSQHRRQQPEYVMQQQQAHQQRTNTQGIGHLPWWQTLCVYPPPIPVSPTWSYNCPQCGALLLSTESCSVCCQNGRDMLPCLPAWLTQFKTLLQQPAQA